MRPAALLLLLAGVAAWGCPEGFQETNFDQCTSQIRSSSWEEGRFECARRGGPFAVLAPSSIPSGSVPSEILLPQWALPEELGMEAISVDECHVRPGCVSMELACNGLTSVKIANRTTCNERITFNDGVPCNVGIARNCSLSQWRPEEVHCYSACEPKMGDCFKYKEHALQPSMNITVRKGGVTLSISNRHLLDDCWCVLAKLNTSYETQMFLATVLSDLPRDSPIPVTFPGSEGGFERGAFWCQCFDKWTGLMLKTDVYSTGFLPPDSPSCLALTVVPDGSELWCRHNRTGPTAPPEELQLEVKKAVEELDLAMKGVFTADRRKAGVAALRHLEEAFKSVSLEEGSNISFEGIAISAMVLPKSLGVKANGSGLSDVVEGVSAEDLAQFTNVTAAVVLPEPRRVAFVIYKNHSAFDDGEFRVNSPVVEVFADVPYVDLVLRPYTRASDRRCAFWDLQSGKWNTSGCFLRVQDQVNDVCHCHHLTTFAQIVTDTRFLPPLDEAVLEHVSVVGCGTSLLGALGTVVASALCREWRSRKSTLVLLHLTVAVALRDALFLAVVYGGSASWSACVGVGVALHYAEMAAGAWCLVAGVLQVFRFTTLTRGSVDVTHLVLRCVLIAWPVAALPVASLLGVQGLQGYAPGGRFAPGLCFPRGSSLLWSVTLPLGVATLINVGVFLFLVWTLCGFSAETRLKASRHGGPGLRTKALKCVMLFFLLGLPWVFGVPTGSRFLVYVFCITATPQGLVLFVFFVLSNKRLRSSCGLTLRRNVVRYLESRKWTSNASDTSNII